MGLFNMTILSDRTILECMSKGELIRHGIAANVIGASYELRLGNVYYDLTENDRPIQLQPHEVALIKPGHRVVLITLEELLVPDNMLVRIVSKGSLFSVGLSAVATYADPGFSGRLGIVTQNISDKYIALPQLEAIAKADFTKLTSAADNLYNGQHGFQTQIWPIKHQLRKSHAEVASDQRVGTEKDEAYKLLPEATSRVLRNLEARQRLIDMALVIAVIMNALTLFGIANKLVDNLTAIVGNLIASLLVGLVVSYAKLSQRKR